MMGFQINLLDFDAEFGLHHATQENRKNKKKNGTRNFKDDAWNQIKEVLAS